MKDKVDEKLSESQFGFKPDRGTVDVIFITYHIIEKDKKYLGTLSFHQFQWSFRHNMEKMYFGKC